MYVHYSLAQYEFDNQVVLTKKKNTLSLNDAPVFAIEFYVIKQQPSKLL